MIPHFVTAALLTKKGKIILTWLQLGLLSLLRYVPIQFLIHERSINKAELFSGFSGKHTWLSIFLETSEIFLLFDPTKNLAFGLMLLGEYVFSSSPTVTTYRVSHCGHKNQVSYAKKTSGKNTGFSSLVMFCRNYKKGL